MAGDLNGALSRTCVLLGIQTPHFLFEFSDFLRDIEAVTSFLEVVRMSGHVSRGVQVLQYLRKSCIGPLTLYEWIFFRLLMGHVEEVIEYIECAISLDGFPDLPSILNCLKFSMKPRYVAHNSTVTNASSEVLKMSQNSAKEHSSYSLTSHAEMNEYTDSILSFYFEEG